MACQWWQYSKHNHYWVYQQPFVLSSSLRDFQFRVHNEQLTVVTQLPAVSAVQTRYKPSHFSPCFTSPHSISPQKSQKCGDLYEWTRRSWGRISSSSGSVSAAVQFTTHKTWHILIVWWPYSSCMKDGNWYTESYLHQCMSPLFFWALHSFTSPPVKANTSTWSYLLQFYLTFAQTQIHC